MSAYAPLATNVFGNDPIPIALHISLAKPLVWSRLFYNVAVWTLNPQALTKLNMPYMRVIRRLANATRFEAGAETDYEVRCRTHFPAIECHILRMRLHY